MFDNHTVFCFLKHSYGERSKISSAKHLGAYALEKLNIALGDEKNSKKEKEIGCEFISCRPISYTHTDGFTMTAPLHLLFVHCHWSSFLSLKLADKNLSGNLLHDPTPSGLLSKGTAV